MNINKWIPVEVPDDFLLEEIDNYHGTKIKMYPPRCDIPTHMRHGRIGNKIVIEFLYFDKENTLFQDLSNVLSIEYGEYSGRIFKIFSNVL